MRTVITLFSVVNFDCILLTCADLHTHTAGLSMVKAFPYIAEKPQLFDMLAADRHEPSARELMQPAGGDNLEHNAKWQQVVKYLTTVTAESVDMHVPLITTV